MDPSDWESCSAQISRRISRASLDARAMAFLEGLDPGTLVGIACSGGADSVLLTLVLASRPNHGLKWHLMHFDHTLRGDASTADAQFVSRMAAGLGLPFHGGRWDIPENPTEVTMRRARFLFMHRILSESGGSVLCLGHQADDVLESMLMRIARGSGAEGLSAPRPVQNAVGGVTHVRPLLRMDRDRVRSVLADVGAAWREDSSNDEDGALRNRLRHRIISKWKTVEARNPVVGALLSRDRLEDDDVALDCWLKELLGGPVPTGTSLDLHALQRRPRALVRRAVDQWSRQLPGCSSVSRAWVEGLVEAFLVGGCSCVSAGRDAEVLLESSRLRYRIPGDARLVWPDLRLPLGATIVLPDGSWVRARAVRLDARLRADIRRGAADPAREAWLDITGRETCALSVRAMRPGDRYRPLGAGGTLKIGDQFTNRKVPVERRRILPVFCLDGNNPVWSPELPPADEARINEASIHAVQLTYRRQPATFRPQIANFSDV